MINSPVLDTVIGLVFIFLLYSLLATSVKEGIATLFGLRARMLAKGIVEGMLSDTKQDKWILDKTFGNLISIVKVLFFLIVGYKPKKKPSLGQKFYDHPIIKNYGSNDRYSIPSYIPKENFSTILIEVLKKYFESHKTQIENFVKTNFKESVDFEKAAGITKIYYLIKYLQSIDSDKLKEEFKKNGIYIDKETIDILALHLEKSYQNLSAFEARLENWFDDSMNRVSGWYKRQVQFILLFIGFAIAITFNVNILKIAGKLSTDKDARDKLVQIAIKESEDLKDDPRVKSLEDSITTLKNVNSNNSKSIKSKITNDSIELVNLKNKFNDDKNYAKKILEDRVKESNNLLAVGWGDYGIKANRATIIKQHDICYNAIYKRLQKNDCIKYQNSQTRLKNILSDKINKPTKEILISVLDSIKKDSLALSNNQERENRAYNKLCKQNELEIKIAYFKSEILNLKNLMGFILFAIGVSLGAPFWFDLLQKLIKIRASGKKENGDDTQPSSVQPVQVTVNNNNSEAVG